MNSCTSPTWNKFDNFMSFMVAAIDAILVSQNVALAAESKGLGLCYMGSTLANCDEIDMKLTRIIRMIAFGKSTGSGMYRVGSVT